MVTSLVLLQRMGQPQPSALAPVDATQQPGATAAQQINNAIQAAKSANVAIVDARGFTGEQIVDTTVTIPSDITLLLGAAVFSATMTDGSSAWCIANRGHLVGLPSSTYLTTGVGSSVGSVITNADHSGNQEYFYLSGVTVEGSPNTALVDVQSVFVNSFIRDCIFVANGGIGLWLRNNKNGAGLGPIDIVNCWVNGQAVPGSRPVVIASDGTGGGAISLNWRGGAIEHAGPNNAMLEINGSPNNAIASVLIEGVYFESSFNTNIGAHLIGAQNITLISLSGGGFSGGSSALVVIDGGLGGSSYSNVLLSINPGNGFANGMIDKVNNKTIAGFVSSYSA